MENWLIETCISRKADILWHCPYPHLHTCPLGGATDLYSVRQKVVSTALQNGWIPFHPIEFNRIVTRTCMSNPVCWMQRGDSIPIKDPTRSSLQKKQAERGRPSAGVREDRKEAEKQKHLLQRQRKKNKLWSDLNTLMFRSDQKSSAGLWTLKEADSLEMFEEEDTPLMERM